MSMTQHTIWYKGAPPMDGRRYLLCFKGSTDSDDIICTGSYRYGRPCNEPAPNTKAWRCDCCGKFSDPYYWAEIPKRALPGRFRDGEQLQVERPEAVKESLTSALLKISGFSAYWKCLRGNEEAWENVWNIATDALSSLRTTEESSVVDGERYCHSEYWSENCKWEPGIGCTPKCPECIP